MFGPYTPLQQLDLLADDGTKSYVVGSTNSLLLQQKDRYSDILINVRRPAPPTNWAYPNKSTFSSTKTRSTLHHHLYELRWPYLWRIGAGLMPSPKS